MEVGVTCFPTNGIRIHVSAANRVSKYSNKNATEEQSVVVYYRFGYIVTKTELSDLVPEKNVNRAVFNINTGDRQIIIKVYKNQDKGIWGHCPLK